MHAVQGALQGGKCRGMQEKFPAAKERIFHAPKEAQSLFSVCKTSWAC
nr:hypothetical protein Iba_chr01cCG10280 [Ipomoea batatas]